jgi:hypothetical protein
MSLNESDAVTNYCTECSGTPHAPWCSQYTETCNCALHRLPDPERAAVIDRAIDETLSGNLSQRAFDHAWATEPRYYTNTIERDDAEHWFEVGRRCGRVEQTQINE